MTLLLVHPGAGTSTADVEAGLSYGLKAHGCKVWRYRLDLTIDPAKRWLFARWRTLRKSNAAVVRPTDVDVFYQAGIGALEQALRLRVDAVIVVSAMLLHPEVLVLMKRAGLQVFIVFTESPYDLAEELTRAALVDGCWTNERTSVAALRAVQPNSGYLAHGWHPERHRVGAQPGDETVPAHDVVFVGTAFAERVAWLDTIDWSDIDLGLYGNWEALPARHRLRRYLAGKQINNRTAAALYRRATLGLNLYRDTPAGVPPAESLNPRAYELAACGVCALSQERAEGRELFGIVESGADRGRHSRLARRCRETRRRAAARAADRGGGVMGGTGEDGPGGPAVFPTGGVKGFEHVEVSRFQRDHLDVGHRVRRDGGDGRRDVDAG